MREAQQKRFAGTNLLSNGDMGPKEAQGCCVLDDVGKILLKAAMRQLGLSTLDFHRILEVSRTIADLAGAPQIETAHP